MVDRPNITLTERDLELFYVLYKFRALNVPQIHELFFRENERRNYVYKRLYVLKHSGFLEDKAIVKEDGRKSSSVYFIKIKALEALKEYGIIDEYNRNQERLRLEGRRMAQVLLVNDILVQLTPFGYQMKDSRETKATFALDRNSHINGCLITPDGKKTIAIYAIEQYATEKMMNSLITEVKKMLQIDHVLIMLNKPDEQYEDFERIIRKEMHHFRSNVMLLPFQTGMYLLKKLGTEKSQEKMFEKIGPVRFNQKGVFPYTVLHNGEPKYIVEYAMTGTGVLRKLKRYSPADYRQDGKKVIVLTWEGMVDALAQEFEHFEYVEFVGVNFDQVPDLPLDNTLKGFLKTSLIKSNLSEEGSKLYI
ncbi:hypothetical protein M2444_004765 [Paenibacillus sp. PastF-3]|uniref:replication-relaxation family protein n=1 Tax=Paenibacillus sp. VTT E-133291 TaxID=1986223 RepID=UPI000BA15CC9|nr:replication-relaxation family protein [Paenibacillus sp. VTT E-133291]MDH6372936.1 hypothetical protein [Paenibacillus sp. PastF-3]OZQ77333.1 hypothetical protein CA598_29830 [Paenibacillus sp. VTT E-133291]